MKIRLDQLLVDKGHFESREKAKRAVMAGLIRSKDIPLTKPGEMVDDACALEVQHEAQTFVSRGGNKLEKAIGLFGIDLMDAVCMDIGASTGGFTDCMLQHGASQVYAVDVGYGQLDWKLRQDPRVINMERTNIRHLDVSNLASPVTFISVDVSFISLKLVMPKILEIMPEDYHMLLLIKPQFEAGKERMKKSGVIRDPEIHFDVLMEVLNRLKALNLDIQGLSYSPITGPKGNIEFLCYLKKGGTFAVEPEQVKQMILEAHHVLK